MRDAGVLACAFLLSLALVSGAGFGMAGGSETVTITVVTTNDLHGHLQQLPLIAGYVANLRVASEAEGGGVLLLDAGDMFQGTLLSNLDEGATMVAAMNLLGYHATTIGSHEFDYGPVGPRATPADGNEDPRGALRARAREASFPFLSSNVIYRKDGRALRGDNIVPSTMVVIAGIRVGIVGGTSMDSLIKTIHENVRDLALEPLQTALRKEALRLRSNGADVIVGLVHAGGSCLRFDNPMDLDSCEEDSEIFRLARLLKPGEVDLLVGGHVHEGIAHFENGIPILAAYSNGRAFGRADLTVDPKSRSVLRAQLHAPHPVCQDDLEGDRCELSSYEGLPIRRLPAVEALVSAALARSRVLREQAVGAEVVSPVALDRTRQSPFSNLFADWLLAIEPTADLALTNTGGLRAGLSAGPVSYAQLFQSFPFDDHLALVTMRGSDLAAVIAKNLQGDAKMLAIAGMRATATCAEGQLEVQLRRPDGRTVGPGTRLLVATTDFLATGGDGALVELGDEVPVRIQVDEPLIRDRIVKHLESTRPIIDGDAPALGKPRILFDGERPVLCSGPASKLDDRPLNRQRE